MMMMCKPIQRNAGKGGGSGKDNTSKPLTEFPSGSNEEISALKEIAIDVLKNN